MDPDPDPDPGGPKKCRSCGSGFGSAEDAMLYVGWSLNATPTIFEDLIDYTFFDW
jgi:hypothetical protein